MIKDFLLTLRYIDNFIYRLIFIPIAHFCGRRWGSTACSLARACISPIVVFCIINVFASFDIVILVMRSLMILAISIMGYQSILADSVPNPFYYRDFAFRIIYIFLVFIDFLSLLSLAGLTDFCCDLSILFFFYFRGLPIPPLPPLSPERRKELKLSNEFT